ncbi:MULTISPECIES: hypothetical protein [Streptomyces]|uniref:RanBP2-type domain-containing protein n=1 Tax=Streptomyces dengpaensis TaxID=2049881 RepID=A0ABN5IA10_9ACTN|nr:MULTISPECIES: hypothetical protein [Streptomyces]AVH59988.1 hypothetical protein C4B68_34120 [Streptomyces dengpaensis]PIB09626.1 hypothetical protein B1C81_10795 [Streptomyces sp. HG99]
MTDTANWICPQHPFGHTWQADSLKCTLCEARRTASEAIVALLAGLPGWDIPRAERLISAHQAEAAPPADDTIPLTVHWDRIVMHPGETDDDTIVGCLTEDGRPAALVLDDEHREALGLMLVDPDGN